MLHNYGRFDECAVRILHPEAVDSRFLQIVGTYLTLPYAIFQTTAAFIARIVLHGKL